MPRDVILTSEVVVLLQKIADGVRRGDLLAFEVGGQWRFKLGDIDAWTEAQKRADHQRGEE